MPDESSDFNNEKYDVIKKSITNNLIQAMHVFNYEMPELTGEDWDLILNNVTLIAFMQGIPVGTTSYNDYTIAVSSENKEIIRQDDIYYVARNKEDKMYPYYHRIWCPYLTQTSDDTITGYQKIDFENKEGSKYKDILACYYCMVNASRSDIEYAEEYDSKNHKANYNLIKRKSAVISALANEKQKLIELKHLDFPSGSTGFPAKGW